MTGEEAIKEIIRAYDVLDFSSHMDNRRKEAFNMAKVALEQEPVLDKVRAEIEEHCGLAKENHCRYCSYCNNLMGIREILEIIGKYKTEMEDT